jgi:anti-sigma factor RsiW
VSDLAQERFRRDHRWSRDRMSDYLDGDLSSDALRRLEQHLAECEECRAVLAGLRRTIEAVHRLARWPADGPAAARLTASVQARIRAEG